MGIQLRKVLKALYPERFSSKKLKQFFAVLATKRFILTLLAVIILITVSLFLLYYNNFLSLQYDVEESRAQIDTQLQRRKNVILSLNLMVIEYAKHEKELFKYVADMRKEMVDSEHGTPPKDGSKIPDELEAVLSGIIAIAERYPDLRLSESFQSFMDALVDAENKIADQRMVYNERANEMSTEVEKFPGLIFAGIYGFEAPPFFQPEPGAQKLPKVGS